MLQNEIVPFASIVDFDDRSQIYDVAHLSCSALQLKASICLLGVCPFQRFTVHAEIGNYSVPSA